MSGALRIIEAGEARVPLFQGQLPKRLVEELLPTCPRQQVHQQVELPHGPVEIERCRVFRALPTEPLFCTNRIVKNRELRMWQITRNITREFIIPANSD